MFLPWIVLDSLNICEIYNRDKRSLEDIIVSPSIRTQVHGFAENEEVLKMQSWHRIRHCSMKLLQMFPGTKPCFVIIVEPSMSPVYYYVTLNDLNLLVILFKVWNLQGHPSPYKPMMSVAYSPYFSKIYKFPPIFVLFRLFWLPLLWLWCIYASCLTMYWTPL